MARLNRKQLYSELERMNERIYGNGRSLYDKIKSDLRTKHSRTHKVKKNGSVKRILNLLELSPYQYLHDIQAGKCAICGIKPQNKALAVDHDHESFKVRGLLCGSCNGGLGFFKDNPKLLMKATRYLKRK